MQAQRIVIVSGRPTDAEIAAITVALERHLAATTAQRPPASRWIRAARLEGCGHPPIDQPSQLGSPPASSLALALTLPR
jgi:hypothetical protein